ncbi:hypothetical protein AAVH_07048, partial [Aphelenchoides avenae]
MFDVANATWYRLVAYACQNLPVHRDAGGDQETPQDTGYDHLVLRVWNPSKRRFFQVDSIKDDEGIECYELRGADYIRPGKALFAMYEK